ncbi:MAG TPA: hypothetical protein VL048_14665 [Xanthobacteraceae bacterium]|nr:hypothetical protein [Xanthobacteraceae bacterium]
MASISGRSPTIRRDQRPKGPEKIYLSIWLNMIYLEIYLLSWRFKKCIDTVNHTAAAGRQVGTIDAVSAALDLAAATAADAAT